MTPQDKSPEYVQDLENGKLAIDSQALEDCAAAFGLSAGEIVEIAVSESVTLLASEPAPVKESRKQSLL
jgi:hypothetical protein